MRSNEHGNNRGTIPSRRHLKPEDAAKASQLDVSMEVGDWITLAARAAVFAALDSANNPVPAHISFVNGKNSEADECLEKARKALDEAEKAAKIKEKAQQHSESVTFINADEVNSDEEDYEYPKEDYSDFTRTSASGLTGDDSVQLPGPPSHPRPQSSLKSLDAEEVEIGDDESETSTTQAGLPGPPSIAMSNQSTIPTQPSTAGTPVPFTPLQDAVRGPFRRDFENGMSQPMEQEDESEKTPQISV